MATTMSRYGASFNRQLCEIVGLSTDTLNEAIGKVEKRVDENQNAIDDQQNTTASGGNGYALINGIRLYVSSTAPTGDIPDGSIWIGG